jgi:hypothetical protein
MSAVIWLGIVAVWAFVLIPTWVRRSDINWRRFGDHAGAKDKLGRAARVITRGRSGADNAASARSGRTGRAGRTVAAGGRLRRVTSSLPHQRQSHPGSAARPSAAAGGAATDTAPSAQAASAVEAEDLMDPRAATRPAPRRSASTAGSVPPHVQRARKLVWIGAVALATLMLAVLMGGMWILLNLIADAVLLGYLRHLRGIAKQQAARKAARQTAAARSERSPERPSAPPEAPTRPARGATARHRATTVTASATTETVTSRGGAEPRTPRQASRAEAAAAAAAPPPQVIDLTDAALADDCPTQELISARAV